mgnify:CR=1 FL=1
MPLTVNLVSLTLNLVPVALNLVPIPLTLNLKSGFYLRPLPLNGISSGGQHHHRDELRYCVPDPEGGCRHYRNPAAEGVNRRDGNDAKDRGLYAHGFNQHDAAPADSPRSPAAADLLLPIGRHLRHRLLNLQLLGTTPVLATQLLRLRLPRSGCWLQHAPTGPTPLRADILGASP